MRYVFDKYCVKYVHCYKESENFNLPRGSGVVWSLQILNTSRAREEKILSLKYVGNVFISLVNLYYKYKRNVTLKIILQ